MVRPFLGWMQSWERQAAGQVDAFVAISDEIQKRVQRCYGRGSDIIYPPVDTQRFEPTDRQDDYFLIVSRLIPYKRIDLAVRAFTQLGFL